MEQPSARHTVTRARDNRERIKKKRILRLMTNTKDDLMTIAEAHGIKVSKSMNKEDIVALLYNNSVNMNASANDPMVSEVR